MLGKLAFVLALVFNFVLIAQHKVTTDLTDARSIRLRSLPSALVVASQNPDDDDVCRPLSVQPSEQCTHVIERCTAHKTALDIPYLRGYFCSHTSTRPAIFAGLVVLLLFLFSTLGITASDFFCPNLATIAYVLGLDETVAGVTFLAFGNGSPDLFSTFSAMKAGSGSLAIGELVGAASFITSVVVGSLCIIRPFQVPRVSFLRDVGFFTASIALLLVFCIDGKIHAWEGGLLVLLYATYVIVVVVGTWWEKRQARRRAMEQRARGQYTDDDHSYDESYHDDETNDINFPAYDHSRTRAVSHPDLRRSRSSQDFLRPDLAHNRLSVPVRLSTSEVLDPTSPPETPAVHHNMPSFSLLGALEFRDVIASLRTQSTAAALNVFEGPVSPYAGGRYGRSRALSRASSSYTHSRPVSTAVVDATPWDSSLGLPLSERRSEDSATQLPSPVITDIAPPALLQPATKVSPTVPSIAVVGPSSPTFVQPEVNGAKRSASIAKRVYAALFPSLQNFREKSWLGRVAAVLSVPALLALTITLPVVVTPETPDTTDIPVDSNGTRNGRLIDIEEADEHGNGNGFDHIADAAADELHDALEDVLLVEEEVLEAIHGVQYSRWLTAVQCICGPLLCWAVLLSHRRHALSYLLAFSIASVAVATLVVIFSDRGNNPAGRTARTFMGFGIAVVWIMAIADEVVAVLQTFGHIYGLSDAIIGLTIFAVGNSMGDFVADLSVASFAPLMAFAACFGGPMLNILLGVGLSGLFIISAQGTGEPYRLHFSSTLLVSTVGLLSLLVLTMVFVPWNGYMLTKRWGVFLILCYLVIMTTNIIVEVSGL